jgi:hypothetical protein
MSKKISKLTDEQVAGIERDKERVLKHFLDDAKLNKEAVERIMTKMYQELGKPQPEFFYVDSPFAAINLINEKLNLPKSTYHRPFHCGISELYWVEFYKIIERNVDGVNYEAGLKNRLDEYHELILASGHIFTFEDFCVVSDHPIRVSFNDENRLNRINGKAIEFKDGYGVYAFNGVRVPEKYGNTEPHTWNAKEVISESNVEIRRVLIEVMGYENIISQLGATELDSWREYTLLQFDSPVEGDEAYTVLKMTCPSTAHIHALRVPPEFTKAREAATWVNHGIDPMDFESET